MIIPIGHAQVTYTYFGPALPNGAANTFGIDMSGSLDGTDLAHFLYDEWTSVWCANADSSAALGSCIVKLGPNDVGPVFVWEEATAGSVVGTGCPPNTALLVQKKTVSGGRANRGRMYLPAPAYAAGMEEGVVPAGTILDLNDRLATFQDNLVASAGLVELFHTSSSDPTIVTSMECSARLATQRRRLRR